MLHAIVPAYNEAHTIGSVVRSLFQHADTVVVVDDGSTDGTGDAARAAGATVIVHAVNRGQGAALETGHEYARKLGASAVLHFDADGQFDADDIPGAVAVMKKTDADIVFGSRFLEPTSPLPAMKRLFILPVARAVDRFLGAPALTDAHNGFRLLNAKALAAIRLTQDRMAHATEIPVLAARAGLRIAEHPVRVAYQRYGQDARGGLGVLKDLFLGRFL